MALLVSTATAAVAAAPDFVVVTPQPGAVVTSPVTVHVEVKNATIGKPTDGLDHLHYSVDGGPEIAVYENKDVTIPLKPGMHVLAVELAGPTHRALLPAKQVPFMVAE